MTLALRCLILGLLCGLLVGYLYKPDLIVVLVAFVLGHLLGLIVSMVGLITFSAKDVG